MQAFRGLKGEGKQQTGGIDIRHTALRGLVLLAVPDSLGRTAFVGCGAHSGRCVFRPLVSFFR